jgi:ribosomal protein S27AE
VDTGTKPCIACSEQKSLTEYYPHKGMKDGLLNKCKACCRRYSIEFRNQHLEHYREYDRQRFKTTERQQSLARRQKRYRASNPEKNKARNDVSRALRTGVLVRQPCEKCGDIKVDAHHDDYSKPLDVRWLCRRCHLIEHDRYIVA